MTEQDKIDWHDVKRIYVGMMVSVLENDGLEAVHKKLGELFEEETLKLFSANMTKEELKSTIMAMKREKVIYRKDWRK